MSQCFDGQVVAVVGAASGIGRATAIQFRRAGATVAWLDRSAALSDVVADFESEFDGPGESIPRVNDATDYPDLSAFASELLERCGRVDHVVVSIGMASGTLGFPFWNLEPAQWSRVVDVNLIAPVNVVHAFVPALLRNEAGSICLVSSVAGQIGSQTDPPYSAAKAGLINFAQCAAKDLAAHHVRVNAVAPGMVKTPLNRQVWQSWRDSSPDHTQSYDDWADEKIRRVAPLGTWQTCDDVAAAILFLASPSARNITGQTINVDGGQVMH